MIEQIKNINSLEELQALHTATFGKNGTMTARLKTMKDLSLEARAALNLENSQLREVFAARQTQLEDAALNAALEKDKIDMSLDAAPVVIGKIHPLTRALREIGDILLAMGYSSRFGPEIEDDWHNFTALNTPEYHPARDMQDTFFIDGTDNVLRTQTSAIQIREMEKSGAPIKIFAAGATFRRDMDATHSPMFHQIEGLNVGKDITLQDMISDIKMFLELFFQKTTSLRIRPSYFPFTDPSVEIDVLWDKSTGNLAQNEDKNTSWLEIMGAGMVHPNVLKNCNINPDEFQGYAWGFGWDRLAMLKYGLNDIRKFYDGDIRWLQNEGF
ncbi:MAG: phenylalanine--tRNA ligase subunit alpha [Rickettsiales bacterium]|jgi:phenylalanyl-tRNA synthetase alpha chain|nr:phenylalanine--tRNA ligase subunit alpha [Rickettsiales bacterium]